MKKLAEFLLVVALVMSLVACGSSGNTGNKTAEEGDKEEQTVTNEGEEIEEDEPETVEEKSTESAEPDEFAENDGSDRYVKHISNYVGKNVASVGYLSMGGNIMDSYGNANIKISFISEDGTYIDPQNEEQLKQYVVVDQMPSEGSELDITYQVDSDGEEYDNLTDSLSYDEIVLVVKPVEENGLKNKVDYSLTEIKPAPDKYTRYIADYVGRNLASCGYLSMGGDLRAESGASNIKITIIADDGSYIDPKDKEDLSQYVVTGQSPEPNTENKLTFSKDSDGNEYSNVTEEQTVEGIDLNVTKLPQEVIDAQPALITDNESSEEEE